MHVSWLALVAVIFTQPKLVHADAFIVAAAGLGINTTDRLFNPIDAECMILASLSPTSSYLFLRSAASCLFPIFLKLLKPFSFLYFWEF